MRAGRARPLRAADMKKDVRILLVGERESAALAALAPGTPGLPVPFGPALLPRAPGPPRPLTPFRLPAGGPQPLTSSGPPRDLPPLSPGPPPKLCPQQPLAAGLVPPKVLSFPSPNLYLLGLRVSEAASFSDPLSSEGILLSLPGRCWNRPTDQLV